MPSAVEVANPPNGATLMRSTYTVVPTPRPAKTKRTSRMGREEVSVMSAICAANSCPTATGLSKLTQKRDPTQKRRSHQLSNETSLVPRQA